jgi:D-cysteine desulfhydrase
MDKAQEIMRIPIAHLPTPLEFLPRLSAHLGGTQLYIKRDDQTGLALGGNKTRKLEYLLADALAQGADTVITAGAMQSNHCRQTAAAAARVGLQCALVLGGTPPDIADGNLLLDQLLGAEIYWAGIYRRGERLQEIADQLQAVGRRPYLIPYGGSNAIGAASFAFAIQELCDQLEVIGVTADRVVVASSSGGTQAGMQVGARAAGFEGQVVGIQIDKGEVGDPPYRVHLAELAQATAAYLGLALDFDPLEFIVREDFMGAGYGIVGELEREAIYMAGRLEGLLFDPVYTARAFGGLIAMLRSGEIGPQETVVFWHTGGAPALFAYARDLAGPPGESRDHG